MIFVQIDYNYLCQGLGHLTGLETRVYQNGQIIERYSQFIFDPDVSILVQREIKDRQDSAFYVETENLLLFGIIKSKKDNVTLILGPTSKIRPVKQELYGILRLLGESNNRMSALQEYFAEMVPYPFENFLEIICFINYAVNEEKLSVSDLIKANNPTKPVTKNDVVRSDARPDEPHNTYQFEKLMLSSVKAGNVEVIQDLCAQPPTGRVGLLAQNELRQRKNTFICSATLISRAAIAGGMPSESAFVLSDMYIQKAELLTGGGDIAMLNMEMLMDYTKRVETLKCGEGSSRLARDIMRYVLRNLNKKITTSDIAKELYLNRSYLCERFQLETGKTVGEFVAQIRIDEAKRLFTVTNLTITQVSDSLSFSSQSYFQTVFKRYVGCTPGEYLKNVRK